MLLINRMVIIITVVIIIMIIVINIMIVIMVILIFVMTTVLLFEKASYHLHHTKIIKRRSTALDEVLRTISNQPNYALKLVSNLVGIPTKNYV